MGSRFVALMVVVALVGSAVATWATTYPGPMRPLTLEERHDLDVRAPVVAVVRVATPSRRDPQGSYRLDVIRTLHGSLPTQIVAVPSMLLMGGPLHVHGTDLLVCLKPNPQRRPKGAGWVILDNPYGSFSRWVKEQALIAHLEPGIRAASRRRSLDSLAIRADVVALVSKAERGFVHVDRVLAGNLNPGPSRVLMAVGRDGGREHQALIFARIASDGTLDVLLGGGANFPVDERGVVGVLDLPLDSVERLVRIKRWLAMRDGRRG